MRLKDDACVRIYLRRGNQKIIGPVGCFEVGDRVTVEGVPHVVVSVDADAAGVVMPAEVLNMEMRELQLTRGELLYRYRHVRTCYPMEWASQRGQELMLAERAANRARYCVNEEAQAE